MRRRIFYALSIAALLILIFWAACDLAGAAPLEAGRTVRVAVSINATVHVYPEAEATHAGINWRCGAGKWYAVPDGGFRPQCRGRVTIRSASTWFDYAVILPGTVA